MKLLNTKSSSRAQIRIKEVRDGILVLQRNKYRMILETSSINFELKSEVEQDAIIDSFQHFLNSLPSPLQIIIRVREVDIQSYLENFMRENNHEKVLVYKNQLKNYSEFIKKLISGNKIMTRHFYIVIPLKLEDSQKDFNVVKQQLKLSADIITKGLEKLGMKTRTLGNLEILEMFYSIYNPSKLKSQPLNLDSFNNLFNHDSLI